MRPRVSLFALLALAILACAAACGGDEEPAAEPEPEPVRTEDDDTEDDATELPERLRFDLLAHAARAEQRQAGDLTIDFGTPGAALYTLGGWRTRIGSDVRVDGTSATLIEGVTGEIVLPSRCGRAGADEEPAEATEPDAPPVCEATLVLRARAFADGRLTVYLDGETLGHARLPTDDFAVVRVPVRLSAGEHRLQLRVPEAGRHAGRRAGIALDWLRVAATEAGAASERAPSVPPALERDVRYSWPLEVPAGARLRGEVEGSATIVVRGEDGLSSPQPVEGVFDVDLAPYADTFARIEITGTELGSELRAARVVTLDPPPPARTPRRPRNVLVYLVDTVRADRLRPWAPESRVQTPGLDRWARSAIVMERGRTQENWTKPSVATLLTGLMPWTHTATSGDAVLPRSVDMLSETLREADFHTGAFVCNGYVSDAFGFEQGWSTWRNYIREGRRTAARFVAADVLEWLDAIPAEGDTKKPFFLYVHTIDPHVPYIPPDETLALYDPEPYEGPVDFTRDRELLEKVKSERLRLNARDRRRLEALYDAEITYHDTHFASILDGLERRGLADDTLVVFTSDHGEEFFDHESVGHGHSLYEELLHVPLVLKVPGIEGPVRVPDAVGLVDIVPTILDALEMPREGLDGRSLLPLLRGEPTGAPPVTVAGFMEGWRSVVVGRFKLIQRTHRRWMLFDLEADPGERNDLADDRPMVVRALRGLLGLALAGGTRAHEAETTEIDAETDAQLRALGYVGAERPASRGDDDD